MEPIISKFHVLMTRRRDLHGNAYAFYTRGIKPTNIPLHDVVGWSIYRQVFSGSKSAQFSLKRHFIAFQRLWRAYSALLRRVRSPRFILRREIEGPRRLVWPPLMATLYATAVSSAGAT
jgi:hypothetical protein